MLIRRPIPGSGWVFCSTDYASGELCTFAQVLLWVVGRSKMAEVINASKDPGALHTSFGAKMAGRSPDEFKALVKAGDKTAKAFRQAAKALNFGLGGGMGEAKFVLSKRKKNEGTTPASDGKIYNGLRFCILVGGAERCGVETVTEWKGRPTAPICRKCVEVVRALKAEWLAFFDEVPKYFQYVSNVTETTGIIGTCPCGMKRGGLEFTDGANHSFQHLLSCGAKRALWSISREMYTDRSSVLYGSRVNCFFHDELFSEMPEDIAHLAGPRQAKLMVEGLKEFCPDVFVDCQPALMRAWSKSAETVYVDGKLVPWEPKEKA